MSLHALTTSTHMMRTLFLTASFLAVNSVSAVAQSHPGSHVRPAHGPGHVRPDSVTHALIHGNWIGTITSHRGAAVDLNLSVVYDSVQRVLVAMHADSGMKMGAATAFVVRGDSLQWM